MDMFNFSPMPTILKQPAISIKKGDLIELNGFVGKITDVTPTGKSTCTIEIQSQHEYDFYFIGGRVKLKEFSNTDQPVLKRRGWQSGELGTIIYHNPNRTMAYTVKHDDGREVDYPKEVLELCGNADPIIVHPDVRRTLMTIRAFNEAARALVLWTALKGDVAHRSDDDAERQSADDHMGLMTPVIKGVLTDIGFDNTVAAQQMYGGHGYIAEWGMEQFVRDARIAMLYEGTNGIQALDLVGRKLPRHGGRAVMAFFKEVEDFIKENSGEEVLTPYLEPLKKGLGDLQNATMWFMQNAMAKPDNAGAGSTDYMHLFGLVALGFMWAQMAKAASAQLANGADGREDFYNTKLTLGRHWMERVMPETGAQLARISNGSDTIMSLPAEAF